VVPSFIARALRGEALQIAGDGRQTRQFVYVVDLADAIVAALAPAAAGRIYNIVGEEETSVRQIADEVRDLVAPVPIVHGPERPADVHLGHVSGVRIAKELNWTPRTSFRAGLKLYLDWLTETSGSPVADAAASTAGSAAAVFSHESPEP
jgi:UDP-glucose 4-epimerase